METHNSTPEESTPEKSLCEEYDDVEIKSADTAREPVLVDEFEVDLKSGEGRVHSLPSECESGYDDTPSECDLIVGEVDGETSNLSVLDTEDEGRGSTRVGATSNLDYIDEGRDSVETEYAADDSGEIHLKHDLNFVNDDAGALEDADDNSLSAVTELSSCANTETVTTRNDKENDNDNVTAQKDNNKSEISVKIGKDIRLPTGLDPSAYSSLPRRGKSSSTQAGQRYIPTTRSVELRAGKILAAYQPHSRPGSNTRLPESRYSARSTSNSGNTSTKVNTIPTGLTKSESLHSRISVSATLGRGSRNSSPVAQRSPRARSASGRGSPTSNYGSRRHGTHSTLSSPGRRSTAASPAATLERSSPECRRSCATSPFSSFASLDRRVSPLSSSGDRRGYTQSGGNIDRHTSPRSVGADRRGISTSIRKQNSPKHTTSPSQVTNYSSLKRPPKPRMPISSGIAGDSDRLARSSSVSTISSLSSRSSGSRSKSFRELNQARVSEPEPFSCSRDCGLQWKQSQNLRPNSSTKVGGKGGKGKPLQLWEIQQTLGRGDFIEGVLNVDFSNGLENYIYAPIQLGRADGHFDRTSQHARRIQR